MELPSRTRCIFGIDQHVFLWVVGNKSKLYIGFIIFEHIAAHSTYKKVNHPIGFPSLICELVLKKCPELKKDYDAFSRVPLRSNADPKLFTEKHKNNIKGEHTATIV